MAGRGRGGRLVIEPFRTTMQTDPQFATRTWKVLEDAIRDIFEGNARHLSFESLYRSSYNMVLHRRAEMLYNNLGAAVGARCDAVAGPVADKNDDEFLGAMHAVWEKHKVAMGMLRDILMYLDRTYVEQSKRLPVYALGLELFRDRVARHERIRRRLLQSMLERIGREREGERIDRSEAKSVADMYSEISHALYVEDFEAPFLDDSTRYYEGEAQKHIASDGCADYLRHASTRLEDEAARVERYLDARTGPKLRKRVQGALIGAHMGTLLEMEGTGLVAMLRGSHTADLRRMYSLFREVDGGAELMLAQVQAHLTEFGTALVNDPHKNSQPLEMVRGLLELKAKFDHIVAEAFTTQAAAAGAGAGGVAGGSGGGSGAGRQPRGAAAEARWAKTDKKFALAVSASFEVFMNRNSRTPEYLAIYLDKQLRSGLRDVDEAEAEARLDSALGLFKLLQEKDVFEKYYKQHLAKRLLGARSVSDDLEKSFVTKLKNECGSGYTGQMEAMFNDMRNSIDTNEAYREHVSQKRAAAATAEGGGGGGGGEAAAAERPELTVQVLTTGCWPVPAAAQGPQALPAQLAPCSEEFAAFYLAQHSGRKLSWRTTMGSADLRCTLGGKRRELVVSTQQMLLLLQFNLHQSRTAAELREATGLEQPDLVRNLQSLACVKKHLILRKEPPGRQVAPTDVLRVNDAGFVSKLSKIKVATVSAARESTEQVAATRRKVDDDRKPLVEAAVVRVMKSRKVLDHNSLIAEVTKQLGTRFVPDPPFIKKRIESLIERDYLERAKDDQRTYRYIS